MGAKSKQKKPKKDKSTKVSRRDKAAARRATVGSLKERSSKKRVLNRPKQKRGAHRKKKRKGDS